MKKIVLCLLLGFGLSFIFSSPAYAWEVTSPFGWRIHPISGEQKFHSGVDLGADYDTPIGAWLPGIVVYAAPWGGYGNAILVQHDNSMYTLYGHCNSLLASVGQQVGYGQIIATVGSTGYSTGPHVHVELWIDGQYADPLKYFKIN